MGDMLAEVEAPEETKTLARTAHRAVAEAAADGETELSPQWARDPTRMPGAPPDPNQV